jgi:hypothetical protein
MRLPAARMAARDPFDPSKQNSTGPSSNSSLMTLSSSVAAVSAVPQLAVPDDADDAMFFRALDLTDNDDFQRARWRLWSGEHQLPEQLSPADAQL